MCADFMYNISKEDMIDGTLDFDEAAADLRVILLEAATDENKDDAFISDVLGRAGTTELVTYTRGALANQATTVDNTDDESVFDADDITFSAVAAQNAIVAYLIYRHVTNDADSVPVFFIDTATGLPITPNGSDIQIQFPAEGIMNINDP